MSKDDSLPEIPTYQPTGEKARNTGFEKGLEHVGSTMNDDIRALTNQFHAEFSNFLMKENHFAERAMVHLKTNLEKGDSTVEDVPLALNVFTELLSEYLATNKSLTRVINHIFIDPKTSLNGLAGIQVALPLLGIIVRRENPEVKRGESFTGMTTLSIEDMDVTAETWCRGEEIVFAMIKQGAILRKKIENEGIAISLVKSENFADEQLQLNFSQMLDKLES